MFVFVFPFFATMNLGGYYALAAHSMFTIPLNFVLHWSILLLTQAYTPINHPYSKYIHTVLII